MKAVGSGKQPQALQGECGVRERQLLHRQCLHQYQRPRFEPAPVDTPEAGIGKPTDTTPVPDFVVEGMGEQLRRVREEDGLGVAVVAPVDFQLSRTGNGTLHGDDPGSEREDDSKRQGERFGIDMPFTVSGDDAVQPVIGDYIGADNEIVRVDKFPAGSQCRGEGEIGVVDEQIHDSLDAAVQVQGHIVDILSGYDPVLTHRSPPFPRFLKAALPWQNPYRHS